MINNIHFLRFVAASLVIFAHAPLNAFGVSSHAIHLGGFGVDIFFIISGFIIPYILFDASHDVSQLPKMGGVSFFVRRIVRVWPLYLVATTFVFLFEGCKPYRCSAGHRCLKEVFIVNRV